MRTVNVFVAEHGNAFMTDIAGWIVEAAQLLGHDAVLHADGSLPAATDEINLVVAPHEFYLLNQGTDAEIDAAARISVPICTEQPGTKWFEMTTLLCAASPAVLDINPHGVTALRSAGFDARHLRLGGVPSMDRRTDGVRPNDLLFLGGLTDHRASTLAELAPSIADRAVDLRLFDFSRPVDASVSSLVFGADKYDLLASSRIMLNIHRDGDGDGDGDGGDRPGGERTPNEYFEWARMVEAMANGCAVVTEASTGFEPLVEGVHFVATDDLVATVTALLDDPARCVELGAAAAAAVLHDFSLMAALGPALAVLPASNPPTPSGRPPKYRSKLLRAQQIPLLPAFQPAPALRRRVIAALHDEMMMQRSIDAVRCAVHHGDPEHTEVVTSSAYERAKPEVSVIVTLFNYATVVIETLESIAASVDVDIEIIVVDDHSTDDGRAVVRGFLETHPHLPLMLVGVNANRGLPASRNRAIGHARADKIMVMDADNHVYPLALRRLADALDADHEAAFSWSILEEFGQTTGLRSATGWHVPWLCAANHIDAQAMFRAATFAAHGGYRNDDALVFGWEDWEMWLRLAAAGEHGTHVTQMLGRYRTQSSSMLATSNLFGDVMIEHLRALHPDLPWPADGLH